MSRRDDPSFAPALPNAEPLLSLEEQEAAAQKQEKQKLSVWQRTRLSRGFKIAQEYVRAESKAKPARALADIDFLDDKKDALSFETFVKSQNPELVLGAPERAAIDAMLAKSTRAEIETELTTRITALVDNGTTKATFDYLEQQKKDEAAKIAEEEQIAKAAKTAEDIATKQNAIKTAIINKISWIPPQTLTWSQTAGLILFFPFAGLFFLARMYKAESLRQGGRLAGFKKLWFPLSLVMLAASAVSLPAYIGALSSYSLAAILATHTGLAAAIAGAGAVAAALWPVTVTLAAVAVAALIGVGIYKLYQWNQRRKEPKEEVILLPTALLSEKGSLTETVDGKAHNYSAAVVAQVYRGATKILAAYQKSVQPGVAEGIETMKEIITAFEGGRYTEGLRNFHAATAPQDEKFKAEDYYQVGSTDSDSSRSRSVSNASTGDDRSSVVSQDSGAGTNLANNSDTQPLLGSPQRRSHN